MISYSMTMHQPSLESALAAFHAGQYAACVEQCRAVLASHPQDETVITLMAMALHAGGNTEGAAEAYRRLTVLRPATQEYWSNLGLMLGQLDRFAEAEKVYRHALSLAPNAPNTLLNYGLLLFGMGRMAEAGTASSMPARPIRIPEAAGIYASLACFECGDIRRAEALIPPPPSWPSLDAELQHDLATALINVGRIDEAERLLDPAASAQDPAAIARLARLHERTNRVESAQALLDRIRHHISAWR